MYKYKSKCRWNMLLYLDNNVIEIRPGELFESKSLVNSRYLDIIDQPIRKKKTGRPKRVSSTSIFVENSNASSSTKS